MSRQKLRLGPTPYGLGCGEHPNLELGPDPRMIQYVGSGKGDSSSLGQGLGVAQSESFHVGKSELQLKPMGWAAAAASNVRVWASQSWALAEQEPELGSSLD